MWIPRIITDIKCKPVLLTDIQGHPPSLQKWPNVFILSLNILKLEKDTSSPNLGYLITIAAVLSFNTETYSKRIFWLVLLRVCCGLDYDAFQKILIILKKIAKKFLESFAAYTKKISSKSEEKIIGEKKFSIFLCSIF